MDELIEAQAKTEDGESYPAAAFAYVPDPKVPFTWKLRLWASPTEKETTAQVGAAAAAFSPGGFRGQKVQIPAADVAAVKAKIRAAWKKVNPDKGADEMPSQIKEAAPADMSYDDIRRRLSQALKAKMGIGQGIDGPWVRDVFDDHLIYEMGEKSYRLDYTMDDNGVVTTAEPVEVIAKTVYEPVAAAATEAAEGDVIEGDFVQLEEKAISKDGTAEIKIIQPGWGSSGYYSKEMLKRDASIYAPGTHMYFDHPTESEERERPERSLRDLAGELTTGGVYKEKGARGPGVYAQAKVFTPYREVIEELAPHIGLSHRALGMGMDGEAEGKQGRIIEKIVAAQSVDYITKPGAGGEVVQMFEAARGKVASKVKEETHIEEVDPMDEAKLKELEEAKAGLAEAKAKIDEAVEISKENARLKETAILREAHDIAAEKVGASDLPEITQKRLVETLAGKPVIKEGALDKAEFEKVIDEAIKAEVVYVAELTKSGKITGMGSSDGNDGPKQLEESFKRRFLAEGHSEEVAAKMAKEAAQGR